MNRDYTFWFLIILINLVLITFQFVQIADRIEELEKDTKILLERVPVQEMTPAPTPLSKETVELISAIKARYRQADMGELQEIVEAAIRYEATDSAFPTRYDILAVVAIESGFNCKAINKNDHGCMQINKKYWSHFPEEAFTTVDGNIKYGAYLLTDHYLKHEKGKEHALEVYNSGATAVDKGKVKPKYVEKFKKEYLAMF